MIADCAHRIAAATLTLALASSVGSARADPTPISKAETLLFMTPHFKEVQPPSRLHYTFHKSGTLEKGFSNTVDVDVTGEPGGKKKTTLRSFSSTAQSATSPEFEQAETNPVLLFYLDREIAEMKRLTRGSTFHFSKQIRIALAESAQIRNIEIQFGGRTLHAQQITISPYQSDPYRERYPDQRLMAKQYIFTICDSIPGVVYEMRGVVPAASGSSKDDPVIDETLTLTSAGKPE